MGWLQMHKQAREAWMILGLAVLVIAGALLFKCCDFHRSAPTVAAAPQALYKHDWTIRVGSGTYGICQGQGEQGTWELYFGSVCIDTATNVRFRQFTAAFALLGIGLMLSVSAVALLRLRKARAPTSSLHLTQR